MANNTTLVLRGTSNTINRVIGSYIVVVGMTVGHEPTLKEVLEYINESK